MRLEPSNCGQVLPLHMQVTDAQTQSGKCSYDGSLLPIYRNTPSFAPLPSEVNDRHRSSGDRARPGVVGQHQEQAQLLSGRRLLQPHPHLPRRHLLNTRSSKSEIEQILAKDVSAGFQQRLQELLRGEGSQDSGTASLLAPLLLLIFAVALQLLAIRSTIPPGAGAADSEADNCDLRPP